jgi:hypothetical protein
MKIRLNEEYYFWCCDWCDSENLVLRAKLQSGTACGACHRPMNLSDMNGGAINSSIAAGRGCASHARVVDVSGRMVSFADARRFCITGHAD